MNISSPKPRYDFMVSLSTLLNTTGYQCSPIIERNSLGRLVDYKLLIDQYSKSSMCYLGYQLKGDVLSLLFKYPFPVILLPFKDKKNKTTFNLNISVKHPEKLKELIYSNFMECHSLFLNDTQGTTTACNSCPYQLVCLSKHP